MAIQPFRSFCVRFPEQDREVIAQALEEIPTTSQFNLSTWQPSASLKKRAKNTTFEISFENQEQISNFFLHIFACCKAQDVPSFGETYKVLENCFEPLINEKIVNVLGVGLKEKLSFYLPFIKAIPFTKTNLDDWIQTLQTSHLKLSKEKVIETLRTLGTLDYRSFICLGMAKFQNILCWFAQLDIPLCTDEFPPSIHPSKKVTNLDEWQKQVPGLVDWNPERFRSYLVNSVKQSTQRNGRVPKELAALVGVPLQKEDTPFPNKEDKKFIKTIPKELISWDKWFVEEEGLSKEEKISWIKVVARRPIHDLVTKLGVHRYLNILNWLGHLGVPPTIDAFPSSILFPDVIKSFSNWQRSMSVFNSWEEKVFKEYLVQAIMHLFLLDRPLSPAFTSFVQKEILILGSSMHEKILYGFSKTHVSENDEDCFVQVFKHLPTTKRGLREWKKTSKKLQLFTDDQLRKNVKTLLCLGEKYPSLIEKEKTQDLEKLLKNKKDQKSL